MPEPELSSTTFTPSNIFTSPTSFPAPKQVYGQGCNLGCDPEFFFSKGNQVVGAEKVFTKEGKEVVSVEYSASSTEPVRTYSAFVLDGVQVELNPKPHYCREQLAREIASAFGALKKFLATQDGVKPNFSATIELSPQELDSLSDLAKVAGCTESFNAYDRTASVQVDYSTYLKRSAGGHIHLGLAEPMLSKREQLGPILDVLLGNTCVLMDRDPGNVERRRHYGRAGEYRLPKHGFEYRTLSNFWLRSYPLTSFVLGVARLGVGVLYTGLRYGTRYHMGRQVPVTPWDAASDLLAQVNLEEVREAINSNDLALAQKNWVKVRAWIAQHVPSGTGLSSNLLQPFDYFLSKVEEKGLDYWFPDDPLTHWSGMGDVLPFGWENFLNQTVTDQMNSGITRGGVK